MFHCIADSHIRRLTMSSHETPVAAHRKLVLIAVNCLATSAPATGRGRLQLLYMLQQVGVEAKNILLND